MRDEYQGRNKFLHLFEISSPRGFGETWVQNHLNELVQELERPSKKLDESYSGEHDFWYKENMMDKQNKEWSKICYVI